MATNDNYELNFIRTRLLPYRERGFDFPSDDEASLLLQLRKDDDFSDPKDGLGCRPAFPESKRKCI